MSNVFHSIPWTLALSLAAQAGESQAIRIPEVSTESTRERALDSVLDFMESSLAGPSADAESVAGQGDILPMG